MSLLNKRPSEDFTFETGKKTSFHIWHIPINPDELERDAQDVREILAYENADNLAGQPVTNATILKERLPYMVCHVKFDQDTDQEELQEKLIERPYGPQLL